MEDLPLASETDLNNVSCFLPSFCQNRNAGKINKDELSQEVCFDCKMIIPCFEMIKGGNDLNGSENNKPKGCFVDSFSFFGTLDGTFQISPEEKDLILS